MTAANPRWFLAEGATGGFFDMYYLIANPSTQATTVRVTYLLPNGAPLEKDYAVAAQSRLTISVDDEDPRLTDTPVSAIIESLNGGRHRRRAIDVVAGRGPLARRATCRPDRR